MTGRGRQPVTRTAGARAHRVFAGVCEALAVAGVPAALALGVASGIDQAALLSLVVVTASLLLFFAGYEKSRPRLRDVMPVAVFAALAAAGRILFAPIPDFKPLSAIAIIAGAAFGRRSGFMVGALAALVSNFFFGQGPWTPWQMYAWGMVGYLGGLLATAGAFNGVWNDKKAAVEAAGSGAAGSLSGVQRIFGFVPLVAWGFISGILYGLVLNLWSIFGFYHPETLAQALVIYAAALPLDILHGVSTALFLVVLYRPWMRKLLRVKRKYALR